MFVISQPLRHQKNHQKVSKDTYILSTNVPDKWSVIPAHGRHICTKIQVRSEHAVIAYKYSMHALCFTPYSATILSQHELPMLSKLWDHL